LQEEEKVDTIETEEVVEDLGDVEYKEEYQVKEPSSMEFKNDFKEDST